MSELMQLVPLFDETKAYLRKVETVDKSGALHLHAAEAAATAPDEGATSVKSELMQLVPLFDETKAYLRKVETVDKSGALHLHALEAGRCAHCYMETASRSRHYAAMSFPHYDFCCVVYCL